MNASTEIRERVASRLGAGISVCREKSICVFPQIPSPVVPYALWRIFDALAIDPQAYSPWHRYDICVCFEDHTSELIDVPEYFAKSSMLWMSDDVTGEWRHERNQVDRFINARCKDISKRRVGIVFERVFGYPLDVDPRSFTGRIVRKSNANASHDGRVITGPVSAADYEAGGDRYAYNLHIDNIRGDTITDFRLMWFGHLSPMLHRKERLASIRFARGANAAFLEPVSAHFSPDEVTAIGDFCREFELDYGELDCLRDNESGRIYVVDVNNTPASRLKGLSREDSIEAVVFLATGFAEGFLL